MLPKGNQSFAVSPHFLCQLLNISECLSIENQNRVNRISFQSDFDWLFPPQFTVTLWNPTVHSLTSFIRVPVTNDYTIAGPTGQIVATDVSVGCVVKWINLISICLVSSYSDGGNEHSWTNQYCPTSAVISSDITSPWSEYVLFSIEKWTADTCSSNDSERKNRK